MSWYTTAPEDVQQRTLFNAADPGPRVADIIDKLHLGQQFIPEGDNLTPQAFR